MSYGFSTLLNVSETWAVPIRQRLSAREQCRLDPVEVFSGKCDRFDRLYLVTVTVLHLLN
jgi:hypothetical protein